MTDANAISGKVPSERLAGRRKPRVAKVIGVKAPATAEGNRGGDRRVYRGNEQKQDEGIAARGRVTRLANQPNDRRPCNSLERFGEDEFSAPGPGVDHGFSGVKELAGNPVSRAERREIEGEPNQDCVHGDPFGGDCGGRRP